MATFCLVHGGLHGSWCWELLVPELHALTRADPRRSFPGRDPTFSIRCTEDRAVNAEHTIARAERIGAQLLEIPGSHSPFLSRPRQLAELLDTIARSTHVG